MEVYEVNHIEDIINMNRNAYNQLASEISSRESDLVNYKQNFRRCSKRLDL